MKKMSDNVKACIALCVVCSVFLIPLLIGHITDTRPAVNIVTGIFVIIFTILITAEIVNCRNADLKEKIHALENKVSEQQHTKLTLYEIQQQLRVITDSINRLSYSFLAAGFSERVDEEAK